MCQGRAGSWLSPQPQRIPAPALRRDGFCRGMGSLSSASGCCSWGCRPGAEEQAAAPHSLVLGASVSHVGHLSAALDMPLFFFFRSFVVLFKDVLKGCSVDCLVSSQHTAGFEDVLRLQRRSDGLCVVLPAEPLGRVPPSGPGCHGGKPARRGLLVSIGGSLRVPTSYSSRTAAGRARGRRRAGAAPLALRSSFPASLCPLCPVRGLRELAVAWSVA